MLHGSDFIQIEKKNAKWAITGVDFDVALMAHSK